MKWEFHLYDKDSFPSIPHGHSLDGQFKLDVNTGLIYRGKEATDLKLTKKELTRLWNDPRYQKIASAAKLYFKESNKRRVRAWKGATRIYNYKFIFESEVEKSK